MFNKQHAVVGRNGELMLESPGEDGAGWPYHGTLVTKKPTPPAPRDIPVKLNKLLQS